MKKELKSKYNAVTKLLYSIRISKGLNQQQIAQLLGVNQSFISKIELGERRIDIIEIYNLCKALDFDFIEFATQLNEILENETKSDI